MTLRTFNYFFNCCLFLIYQDIFIKFSFELLYSFMYLNDSKLIKTPNSSEFIVNNESISFFHTYILMINLMMLNIVYLMLMIQLLLNLLSKLNIKIGNNLLKIKILSLLNVVMVKIFPLMFIVLVVVHLKNILIIMAKVSNLNVMFVLLYFLIIL